MQYAFIFNQNEGNMLWKKISSSSFTVPLCLLCFNDPNIDFVTIFNLYTKRSVYQHEDFTDNQVETIIESLIEELRNNSILQVKYRQYLQSSREEKLEILFGK